MPISNVEKRREYQKIYHLRTWDKRKLRHGLLKRKRERDLLNWLKEYKKGIICEICGESYGGCLDFHHKNISAKVDNVSDMAEKGYAKETILKEISECLVLCKNCHVKIHDKKVKMRD